MALNIAQIIIEAQDNTKSAADSAESNLKSVSSAASELNSILGAAGLGVSFAAVGLAINKMVDEAKEAEQASSRLTAILRNTGSAAGYTKVKIDAMADSLAAATQFDDESFRNAASEILKFGNIHGDTFRRALSLSADVAAFMGTNVPDAASQLAKAMADPETATKLLKSAGVILTEQQKDQMRAMGEVGDKAGEQALILGRLEKAYKGTAAEMNTGLTKATGDLTKATKELFEAMGGVLSRSTAVQSALASKTTRINELTAALKGGAPEWGIFIGHLIGVNNELLRNTTLGKVANLLSMAMIGETAKPAGRQAVSGKISGLPDPAVSEPAGLSDEQYLAQKAAKIKAEKEHELAIVSTNAARRESLKIIDTVQTSSKEFISGLGFENSLLGKSTAETKLANEQRKIQLQLEKEMLAIKFDDKFKDTNNPGVAAAKRRAEEGAQAAADRATKAAQNQLSIGEERAYQDAIIGIKVEEFNRMVQLQSTTQDALIGIKVEEFNRMVQLQSTSNATLGSMLLQGKLRELDIEKMSMTQKIGMGVSGMGQLLAAAGTHSKSMFEVSKRFAEVDAGISMWQGVAKGVALGWPLGIPAVAWALAEGAATISQIESQNFGGGASGSGGGGGGGGGGGSVGMSSTSGIYGNQSAPSYGVIPTAPPPQQAQAITVNIYNTGNVLSPDYIDNVVIAQIKERVANADVTIIDPRSRQAQMLQSSAA
jgi:hypothetical protein